MNTTSQELRALPSQRSGSAASANPCVDIEWPAGMPVPSDKQEDAAINRVLFPDTRHLTKGQFARHLNRRHPVHPRDFNPEYASKIEAGADKVGMHFNQVLDLRKILYYTALPHAFENYQAESRQHGQEFEATVEAFLLCHGVDFCTEQEQKEAQQRQHTKQGNHPATPDFLIRSPLTINGRPVQWIEVKSFYGAGVGEGDRVKSWIWTLAIEKQIKKYVARYGPDGAVIFNKGYSESMRGRLPECVMLLDAATIHKG